VQRGLQAEEGPREERQREARDGERARRGDRPCRAPEVDLGKRQRAEQQRREEHVIDQLLQPAPEIAAVVVAPREREAHQDQHEVRQDQERRGHQPTSLPSVL
jgi:hypothetical protein